MQRWTTITANQNLLLDAKAKLFNLNADGTAKADGSSLTAIDWNPTHDASTFLSTYGLNTGVLNTNAVYTDGYTVYDQEIGIIGANPGALSGVWWQPVTQRQCHQCTDAAIHGKQSCVADPTR